MDSLPRNVHDSIHVVSLALSSFFNIVFYEEFFTLVFTEMEKGLPIK